MGLTKLEQLAVDHVARAHWSDVKDPRTKTSLGRLIVAMQEKAPGAIERARARYDRERDEARFKGNVPEWAKRLVRKYGGPRVSLTIRRSRTKSWTSGHCSYWSDDIVVTLGGNDEDEQRYVVLHEIAHTKALHGHGEDFYDELYAMVRAEGLYRKVIAPNHAHWGSKGLKAAARRARTKEIA